MSTFVPAQITYAAAVVRNARESRVNIGDRQHAALLECIEAHQAAIVELGRMVADLRPAERCHQAASEAALAGADHDIPDFLRHRVAGRGGAA